MDLHPDQNPRPHRRRASGRFLQAALLVTAFVLLGFWIQSRFRSVYVNRTTVAMRGDGDEAAGRQFALCSHDGRAWFAFAQSIAVDDAGQLPHRARWRVGHSRDQPYRRMSAPPWLAPVVDWDENQGSKTHIVYVTVSYWSLIVALGLTAWATGRSSRLQRRRARRGLCVGCGYDVRMSPERCPECGLVNG
jgi:hypothetical protein